MTTILIAVLVYPYLDAYIGTKLKRKKFKRFLSTFFFYFFTSTIFFYKFFAFNLKMVWVAATLIIVLVCPYLCTYIGTKYIFFNFKLFFQLLFSTIPWKQWKGHLIFRLRPLTECTLLSHSPNTSCDYFNKLLFIVYFTRMISIHFWMQFSFKKRMNIKFPFGPNAKNVKRIFTNIVYILFRIYYQLKICEEYIHSDCRSCFVLIKAFLWYQIYIFLNFLRK